MLKRLSIAAVCVVAGASTAFAQATTAQVVGTVLVNKGTGFAPAGDGVPLAPGDVVMTKGRSSTVLVYADGCRVKVKPRRSVTVGSTVCDKVVPAVVEGGAGLPGGAALAGIAIAGAGIAAGVILANDQKSPPPNGGGGGNGQPMSP